MQTKQLPISAKTLEQKAVSEFSLRSISFIKVGRLLILALSVFISVIALKTNSPLLKELFFAQGVIILILIMSNFKK